MLDMNDIGGWTELRWGFTFTRFLLISWTLWIGTFVGAGYSQVEFELGEQQFPLNISFDLCCSPFEPLLRCTWTRVGPSKLSLATSTLFSPRVSPVLTICFSFSKRTNTQKKYPPSFGPSLQETSYLYMLMLFLTNVHFCCLALSSWIVLCHFYQKGACCILSYHFDFCCCTI